MIFIPFTETNADIANSYLSVADADEIILKQTNSDNWNDATNETKQMLLIQASYAVDGAITYKGTKTSSTQLLNYPRDGNLTLPNNIILATALTAMKISNDDIFKNIKSETIAKHTTEYFAKVEIDDDIMVFLKPLRATIIPVFGIEYE
ncbi:MAG: hypothetical protein RBR93_08615 [Aliarcobacter butzleri]|nr:hypothetical protein [Aliarcobacter butzleri]